MAELFKVHIPFLDDVKEKGLKDALVAKTDESVERLTAGMNIEAVRSMLRGDPVTRPNPRVKPHADGFWLHMRPTYYNKKVMPWYPTFRLGFLAVYFLVVETITGVNGHIVHDIEPETHTSLAGERHRGIVDQAPWIARFDVHIGNRHAETATDIRRDPHAEIKVLPQVGQYEHQADIARRVRWGKWKIA